MDPDRTVTAHGNPLALVGRKLMVGDKAPDFKVLNRELKEVTLGDFKGKVKLISVTPSLDTPVCDTQARRFNQEAVSLPDVAVLNISMDLPFAVGRFCDVAGIDRVTALSDHRDASFGTAYGVLIKELRLLARSVFIVDSSEVVRYVETVPEITDHADYDKALEALRAVIKNNRP